ncbi:MlaD family protein [Mycobacterium sp. IS-3022]|uniref:MlaD family protein n=1 Tax=Mycobacterium sp. IS-3022 TaxID=1772277 RepID=UPI0007415AC3|nr:MlaD family protein [Mycobacterium sp. IS-3022]KUH97234.1 mammalian cell entry protein [Mycobacterium sp. IS-3022]KUH97450.1 mammalian cell entry protein [Mycobacterium sp. IS-3022]
MTAARLCVPVITALALALTPACSLDPTDLPVPGSYVPGDAYRIKIEFSSVLNLPAKAKVDSGGVQVGVLDHVALDGSTAVASVDISSDVRLPQNTRAELRQATVLGDIYIALLTPDHPSPTTLHDGDAIPLSNTAPADNVEDVLRSVSDLASGGGLNTLQDTVIKLNNAFPSDPAEITEVQQKVAGTLNDLAANRDTINEILASARNISNSLVENTHTFDRLVTEGPDKLIGLGSVTLNIVQLVIDAGKLARNISPAIDPNTAEILQVISHATPFIGTVATADTTIPTIMDKTVDLIRDKLIGFFRKGGPRYTVTGLHNPDGSIGLDPAARADEVITRMQTMGLLAP